SRWGSPASTSLRSASASSRSDGGSCSDAISFSEVDSGEAAWRAAKGRAIAAALVLLGRSRLLILPGLALLALGELGLVHDLSGTRVSATLAGLVVASLIPVAIGPAILVPCPALVTPLIAIAAPFRPPLSFGSEHHY